MTFSNPSLVPADSCWARKTWLGCDACKGCHLMPLFVRFLPGSLSCFWLRPLEQSVLIQFTSSRGIESTTGLTDHQSTSSFEGATTSPTTSHAPSAPRCRGHASDPVRSWAIMQMLFAWRLACAFAEIWVRLGTIVPTTMMPKTPLNVLLFE